MHSPRATEYHRFEFKQVGQSVTSKASKADSRAGTSCSDCTEHEAGRDQTVPEGCCFGNAGNNDSARRGS